jgi:hypothetical protein
VRLFSSSVLCAGVRLFSSSVPCAGRARVRLIVSAVEPSFLRNPLLIAKLPLHEVIQNSHYMKLSKTPIT